MEKIKVEKGSREETWLLGDRVVLLESLAKEGFTEIWALFWRKQRINPGE